MSSCLRQNAVNSGSSLPIPVPHECRCISEMGVKSLIKRIGYGRKSSPLSIGEIMADKRKRSLDRWLDSKIIKSEEAKSSISKFKMEAVVEDEEKDAGGEKGRHIKLPSFKHTFDSIGKAAPFTALMGKWGGRNNGDEAEYSEDYYEKGDDKHMRPLPGWARFTTNNPVITIAVVGIVTLFLLTQALAIDPSAWSEGRSGMVSKLNIEGSLEVYLPAEDETALILQDVKEYWSTDIIVIYVEIDGPDTNKVNITDSSVLKQMSYIEEKLDPDKNDRGKVDGVVFCFSISTLVKEVNSTGPRVFDATVLNLGAFIESYTGSELIADQAIVEYTDNIGKEQLGTYEIPEDNERINSTVRQMPENVKKKVVVDTNDDGIWDAGVIVLGCKVSEEWTEGRLVRNVDRAIDESYEHADIGRSLKMINTGPLTMTYVGTNLAFEFYGNLMPVAMAMVTLAIMIFHRSFKAVLIAGIPTGCSIVWIYGVIGMFQVEVTPTIIILGPVLLALGVSYGIHLANRIAQEQHADPRIRAQMAIRTTGRAVSLSALTTMIGLSSFAIGDLKPVTTVGISLTMGIGFCYILTMLLAPTIAILVDYRKKSGKGAEKGWKKVSEVPIKYGKVVMLTMAVLVGLSVCMVPLIKTDTDLLSMAPDDESVEGVDKIVAITKYSKEFDAGALGMVLVETEGDHTLRTEDYQDDDKDPMRSLKSIHDAEQRINDIQDDPGLPVNALSIVSIMRTVGAGAYLELLDIPILGQTIYEYLGINPSIAQSTNFWDIITYQGMDDLKPLQKFLLNVFYDSLSQEARGMVINEYLDKDAPDYYTKTLIYVDMPVLTDKEAHEAVAAVDQVSKDFTMPSLGIHYTKLTGVAAIAVAVNDGLIESQKISLVLSIFFVFLVLTWIFWDKKKKSIQNIGLGAVTTLPVVLTVALQPLLMVTLGISLNLATVMIGSTVIGAGVDFSVHITQRSLEGGMTKKSIMSSVEKSGMGLFEATVITIFGLSTAILPKFGIPIPAIFSFVILIMILLVIAAMAAMFVLPAILWTIVQKRDAAQQDIMSIRDAAFVE